MKKIQMSCVCVCVCVCVCKRERERGRERESEREKGVEKEGVGKKECLMHASGKIDRDQRVVLPSVKIHLSGMFFTRVLPALEIST